MKIFYPPNTYPIGFNPSPMDRVLVIPAYNYKFKSRAYTNGVVTIQVYNKEMSVCLRKLRNEETGRGRYKVTG